MTKGYFKENEIIRIKINGVVRAICPDCKYHIQTQADRNDCKNLFYKQIGNKKEVIGQCCCYSDEHK